MPEVGAVRQDPETKAVALRTALPSPAVAWFIATVDNGGHYDDGTECADWAEVTT